MTLEDYIETHTSPQSELLADIERNTYWTQINPRMVSGAVQGRLLSMLSRMIQPTHILEIGTFTGYSTLCLAEGLKPEGRLVTIEKDDELESTIRHNLARSPYNSQIDLLIGDAKEILSSFDYCFPSPSLEERTGERLSTFDLVFLDADKREYSAYLDLIYPHVREGGFILADNTLWDGHVIDPKYEKEPQTLALRAFNDRVRNDDRFEVVLLPLRDGLSLIRKK